MAEIITRRVVVDDTASSVAPTLFGALDALASASAIPLTDAERAVERVVGYVMSALAVVLVCALVQWWRYAHQVSTRKRKKAM